MRRCRRRVQRILAIDPARGGFGFAVVEDTILIDYGLVLCCPDRARSHMEKLFRIYEPSLVTTEEVTQAHRRSPHFFKAVALLVVCSVQFKATHRSISRRQIQGCFPNLNKQERSAVLATRYPEIMSRLPKARKPWQSEPRSYAIFDALALIDTVMHQSFER